MSEFAQPEIRDGDEVGRRSEAARGTFGLLHQAVHGFDKGVASVIEHASHNSAEQAAGDLAAWTSWARRCRLEPFKKLAATIKERFDAVVRGMLDHRSNAFVESMNGQLQQAKRAARGYRTAKSFIAVAYLRLSRLKNLPNHPFSAVAPVG